MHAVEVHHSHSGRAKADILVVFTLSRGALPQSWRTSMSAADIVDFYFECMLSEFVTLSFWQSESRVFGCFHSEQRALPRSWLGLKTLFATQLALFPTLILAELEQIFTLSRGALPQSCLALPSLAATIFFATQLALIPTLNKGVS